MSECAHCGEYLHVDEEWRLRPGVIPGKLETEYEKEYEDWYVHPGCYSAMEEHE